MRGVLPAILVLLAWCVVVTTLFYCVRLTLSRDFPARLQMAQLAYGYTLGQPISPYLGMELDPLPSYALGST